MLKDLIPKSSEEIDEWYNSCKDIIKCTREDFDMLIGIHQNNHIETGIYEFLDCNFPSGFTFKPTYEQEYSCLKYYYTNSDRNIDYEKYKVTYGVADSVEQIKDYYKDIIDDTDKSFMIWINKVWQKDQPEYGGWRWNKWGKYIGNIKHHCEYLYDEDFSPDWQGYVYIFNIVGLDNY